MCLEASAKLNLKVFDKIFETHSPFVLHEWHNAWKGLWRVYKDR